MASKITLPESIVKHFLTVMSIAVVVVILGIVALLLFFQSGKEVRYDDSTRKVEVTTAKP